jgi:predicted permease
VILIVGASLLSRSFVRLVRVDNGYTAEGVLIAGVELPPEATDGRTNHLIDGVLARLRGLHGVSAAGAAAMIPLMRMSAIEPFALPDSIAGAKPARGRALVYWVTPGYAEALGLRLRQGRFFAEGDARRGGVVPTIVNEEFLRQHVAVERVIGTRIPNLAGQGVSAEIVGVVGNVLKDGNDREPQPELYFVHGSPGQRISGLVNFVIRTPGHPAALAPDVRAIVGDIEPEALVDRVEPLTTILAASFDAPRFATGVMTGFASLAMALAAIGLYGVLTYNVSQRVRELGIRAALGARRADLVRLVLREGLSVTLSGIAVGVVAAAFLTRLMRDLLFGVSPLDPATFAIAPAILVSASLFACLGPALRAASADPAATLRAQ